LRFSFISTLYVDQSANYSDAMLIESLMKQINRFKCSLQQKCACLRDGGRWIANVRFVMLFCFA